MKAFTVQQPHIDRIVQPSDLPKRTENRSWPLPAKYIGVPVLLHAGKTGDRAAVLAGIQPGPDVRGAILAVVTFTGCHFDNDGCDNNCATWGHRQVFHWQIADDVIALNQPVPAKGALGFWTPPADVLAAVQQQLAGVAA